MNTSNCLHSLFEEQARLHPNKIAIKFESEEISYQNLDNQSSLLANFLRSNGVETGDKVCIFLERSIKMMVGILGILKSGATYVPIDPKTPLERINFLLNDFKIQALVTVSSLSDKINCKQRIIRLDTDWKAISTCSDTLLDKNIQDSNIAIIFYTSGSTGYPKGVLLSHKSLVNSLVWYRENYNHSPDDIVLQHASYHFDFSIIEMFMALANGGKLILARPDFHYESSYLIELILKEKITKMGTAPSLLKTYINLPDFNKCTSLKQVFIGGETLGYELQNTFFEKLDAELINMYGPTETSLTVLHWNCKRNSTDSVIPIGFPIADMKIYLLDNSNKPVADGDTGEIHIAGVGVADGYLNQPGLTAECFIPDPFLNDNKTRMYKTGDLGKRLPGGSIQFRGRKDLQIKIRGGLRVELHEIEHHILLHKSIKGCVVKGVEKEKGEMKLVAYLVPAPDVELSFENIKNYLLSKLPEYMVPSLFVHMSELPLSPNGKIDRKALPYPDNVRLLSQTPYTPPQNAIHRHLIRIWEEVLHLKPIGITDPFDSLGGDSLATVEIIRLMEKEMGCTLPLAPLASSKTIQDQAEIISLDEKSSEPVYLCREGERTPILFIRHVQGEVTVSSSLMTYLCPEHPFLVTLPFGMEPEIIPDSIEEIAQIYVDSLEKQYPSQEYILGGFSMGGLVAIEIASILNSKGKSVKTLFFIDTFHPEILNKMDNYQIRKRVLFYLRGLLKNTAQNKKAIIKYLMERWLDMMMTLFEKRRKHPIFRRLQELFGVHIDRNKLYVEDKNKELALNFRPKPYDGDVILISAQGKTEPCVYEDQERNESIAKWGDHITRKLYSHGVQGSHNDIMKEPGVESIAQIINKHLLTY